MTTSLVVGANRGIGLELTKALAARGDTVLATCRTPSPELSALGVRVLSDIDLNDDASASKLASSLGPTKLDTVILNAGILERTPLEPLDLDAIRRQLEVNAVAPLRTAAALRSHLASPSKLALITSRMGSIGDNTSGGSYGYRMSKAALNAAGRSLAHDLRGQGVAVVLLHPGYVRTDMTGGSGQVGPSEAARMLIERIDHLTIDQTGSFWHANGEVLPW
jgi:NAD(P)-dependent dehydrogenase (short-subunit alcohol dehydrogenase family)